MRRNGYPITNRCNVALYTTSGYEPIAPRCKKLAPYLVESMGDAYYACVDCAREAMVDHGLQVTGPDGEEFLYAGDIPGVAS